MKKLALVFLVLFFGIVKVVAGEPERHAVMQTLDQMGQVRALLERFMEGTERQLGDILRVAGTLSGQVDSSLAYLEEALVARQGQPIVPSLPAAVRSTVAVQDDVSLLAGRASVASNQGPGIPAIRVSSSLERGCASQESDLCIQLTAGPRRQGNACPLCAKANLESLYSYKKHLLRIHGLGGWKCGACDKRFVMKGCIRKHVRIHLGENPYKCSICNFSFRQIDNCKMHIKRHFKVFGCGYCSNKFRTKNDAKSHHVSVHFGQPEKILQCQQFSALPEPIQSLPGVSSSVEQSGVANQGIRQEMFRARIGRGASADEAQSVQSPGVAAGTLLRVDNQHAQARDEHCMCLRCGRVMRKEDIADHTRSQHPGQKAPPLFYESQQEGPAR